MRPCLQLGKITGADKASLRVAALAPSAEAFAYRSSPTSSFSSRAVLCALYAAEGTQLDHRRLDAEIARTVHAGFVLLFVLTGTGSGSTYKMIHAIFREQARFAVAHGADTDTAFARARRLSGAAIGIVGAVGAPAGCSSSWRSARPCSRPSTSFARPSRS